MSTTTPARPADRSPSAPRRRVPAPDRAGKVSNDLRRTVLALVATMLGAFPLCALFSDRGWLLDVWLTMVVVVAPAALLRRTRAASAMQVWIGVVLLIPWLTVNFVREHAIAGLIPTSATWQDIGNLVTDLHDTSRDEAAPIHTTVAVRLAACLLLGLIAALVDLLAVVGRRGALAGVPLLIVFTVSGAVPRQPVGWLWFALAAVGFLVLLALDSSDDLQRWGHYIPRSAKAGRARATGAASGQRIAAVAIVLAIVLPLFVPADSRNFITRLFHGSGNSDAVGDFGPGATSGSGTAGIDPFVQLHGQLNRDRNVDLLSVKVQSDGEDVTPFYLRTNVLSTFVGTGWRAGAAGSSEPAAQSQFASSPGQDYAPEVKRFSADITVSALRSNPPVFGSPTSLDGVSSSTRWTPQDMLLLGSRTTGGQVIHEEVAQPAPSVADLRAATGTPAALRPWLTLPTISSYVTSLTRSVIGTASTPYAKARAISDFFADPANNFSYSLQTATGDSTDELTNFLTTRTGYCQQYAAAMGVMLRLAGVPSRVVLGYAHSAPNAAGEFTVTAYDAHAWVEAYFDGIGWVPFDPTPLAGISGGQASDLTWAPHSVTSTGPSSSAVPSATAGSQSASREPSSAPAAPVTSSGGGGTPVALPLSVLVVLVVVALLLLVPAAIRWRRRRQRLERARRGDPGALWEELSATATDLGYRWSPARTPRQVAGWLGGSADGVSTSLQKLAEAVERSRYAPGGWSGTDLERDLATVSAGLRARRSGRERWRARFWPASLGWTTAPVGFHLPAALARHR